MATLTTENGYLKYVTVGATKYLPLQILANCTFLEYTDKIVIVLPSETNAHQKSFIEILPTDALTTVSAILAYLQTAQVAGIVAAGESVKTIEYELTRPSDTLDYSAGDVVSNSTTAASLLRFTNAAKANGKGIIITNIRVHTNDKVKFLGKRFRLHLYRDSDVTPINDNVAFQMMYTNSSKRIGFVDFSFPSTADGGSTDSIAVQVDGVNKVCQLATTDLYGQLQILDAVTAPVSGAKIKIQLHLIQTN